MKSSVPDDKDLEESAASFIDKRKSSVTAIPTDLPMPKTPLSTSMIATTTKKPLDSTTSNSALVDEVMAKNKDLEEKLETLKIKRNEDRAKLIQFQQLTEFKNKMQIEHAELQRQYQKAKSELKETQEQFESYKEEMSTAAETIEMATLDKEMAEEQLDQFKQENEELNERVIELEKQVNSMKEDLAQMASNASTTGSNASGSNAAVLSFQLKQSEEQNVKLKEAVIRLRDLNKVDKDRLDGLEKQLEQKSKIIEDFGKEKEKWLNEIKNLEEARLALTEQVDDDMGATEMVEHLTRKNIDLEDQNIALEEERNDLEQLRDIEQQIQEEMKGVEVQLREELDMVQASRHELLMKLNQANDQLADAADMVSRFRQLVASLREENGQLRIENGELSDQISDHHTSQTKAPQAPLDPIPSARSGNQKLRVNQVQLEMSKIEVSSLRKYIELVLQFMPETWQQSSTSEHVAIETYLCVGRIIDKAGMISHKVSDWFGEWSAIADPGEAWTRNFVLQNSESQQINFSSAVKLHCFDLCLQAGQFIALANSLAPENAIVLLSSLSADLSQQERSIDSFVEKLKNSQLDETSNLDALAQPAETLRRMFELQKNSAQSDKLASFGDLGLVKDAFHLMESVAESVLCSSTQIIPMVDNDLLQTQTIGAVANVKSTGKNLLTFARRGLRLLSHIESDKNVIVESPVRTKIFEACQLAVKFSAMLRALSSNCIRLVASNDASSDSKSKKWTMTLEAFNEAAATACHIAFGVEDSGIVEHCGQLDQVVETCRILCDYLDPEGDLIISNKGDNSLVQRAAILRNEIAELKQVKFKLEGKDGEISDLKKVLRNTQDEIDQWKTKVGLLERRLDGAGKDTEHTQRKIEELQIQLVAQKNEAERTLDVYQRQIGQLQAERQELQEKVVNISRRQSNQGAQSAVAERHPVDQSQNLSSQNLSTVETVTATSIKDSPMLLERIGDLELACKSLIKERDQLRMKIAGEKLKNLKPIRSSALGSAGKISQFTEKHRKIEEEISKQLVAPIRSESENDKPLSGYRLHRLLTERSVRLNALRDSLVAFSSSLDNHRPTFLLANQGASDGKCIAEVDFRSNKSDDSKPVIDLDVTWQQFKQIHCAFLAS